MDLVHQSSLNKVENTVIGIIGSKNLEELRLLTFHCNFGEGRYIIANLPISWAVQLKSGSTFKSNRANTAQTIFSEPRGWITYATNNTILDVLRAAEWICKIIEDW